MRRLKRIGMSEVLCIDSAVEARKPRETVPKAISPTEKWKEGPTTRPLEGWEEGMAGGG